MSVLGFDPKGAVPLLDTTDFLVLEDGIPQDISFFESANAPFDLVLLLDLSGSNSKKLKMIKTPPSVLSTPHAIDRIALVTFTDQPAVFFVHSRSTKLKKTIDEIDEAVGGTNFWDAMNYVLRI